MASTPISELIAANLVTTLAGISVAAGYHHTVSAVVRRKQFGQPTADSLIVLAQGDLELNEAANPKNGRITWIQSYWADCYVVEIEGGDPIDTRINKIVSDVMKIVMVDPHRDQLAHDTFPSGAVIMPDEDGGGVAGVSVLIRVQYRTLLTDPNTQA